MREMSSVSDTADGPNVVEVKYQPNHDIKKNCKSRPKYSQRFCQKWLSLFSEWLTPCPQDPSKPYCKACQCRLDSNKCHLRRHEKTSKHKRNLTTLLGTGEAFVQQESINVRHEPIKYFEPKLQDSDDKIGDCVEYLEADSEAYYFADEGNIAAEGIVVTAEELSDTGTMAPAINGRQSSSSIRLPSPSMHEENDLRSRIANDKKNLVRLFKEVIQSRAMAEPPKPKDVVELFFESICGVVKTFSPKLKAEAKLRISQVVGELELRHAEQEQENSYSQEIATPIASVVVSAPSGGTNPSLSFNYRNSNSMQIPYQNITKTSLDD